MSDDDAPTIRVGRERKRVVDSDAPPPRPSPSAEMEHALERLREGGDATESIGERLDHDRADRRERQRFRSEADAADELADRRDFRERQRERQEESERRQAEQDAERSVREAANWSDDDRAVLGNLQQQVEAHEGRVAAVVAAAERAKADPSSVTADQRRQIQQAAQQLAQERQQLQHAAQTTQQVAQLKAAEAQRRQLFRDFPELADAGTRERLVKFAVSRGIPEQRARAETDPAVVGQVFRQMQAAEAEERQAHLDRPRKLANRRGGEDRLTIDEARDRLRRSGSQSDAVNLLAMQRERAKEASDG